MIQRILIILCYSERNIISKNRKGKAEYNTYTAFWDNISPWSYNSRVTDFLSLFRLVDILVVVERVTNKRVRA